MNAATGNSNDVQCDFSVVAFIVDGEGVFSFVATLLRRMSKERMIKALSAQRRQIFQLSANCVYR
jgi:hypothetical protein